MQSVSHWLRFRVQTLDAGRLSRACAELAAMAEAFKPDLLIGIPSGGYVVAQGMSRHFPHATLLPLTCRRPSTQKKQKSSWLKNLLRRLPGAITGPLRILEHIVLTQLTPPKRSARIADSGELAAIQNRLRELKAAPRLLIIDDAVDSGATLEAVRENIRKIAGPDAAIHTAAITVTTAAPLVEPDYRLYRYVLCRFPWSLDFKG